MNDSHNEARQLVMRFAKENLEQLTAILLNYTSTFT